MPDKNDFSELLAEMLRRMDRQQGQIDQTNSILRTVVQVQEKMLSTQEHMQGSMQHIQGSMQHMQQTQERILDRLDRNEAGFNAFANAVLDHLGGIRSDLRELKEVVLNNHEERLRRLEDFMRRAS